MDIKTSYFEHSQASGALYLFIRVTKNGKSDFRKSATVTLNEEVSRRPYRLPFKLSAGNYKVFVYDVEKNKMLLDGVVYPAVTRNELLRSTFRQSI